MAPERNSNNYSFPTDVWSFAILTSTILFVNNPGDFFFDEDEDPSVFTTEEVNYLQHTLCRHSAQRAEIQQKKNQMLRQIPQGMESLFPLLCSCLKIFPSERPEFYEIIFYLQTIVEEEKIILHRAEMLSLLGLLD